MQTTSPLLQTISPTLLDNDSHSIEFGLIATESEIATLKKTVSSLNSKSKSYTKTLSMVKDFIKDYPKLSRFNKAQYKIAKRYNSRTKRDLAKLEPLLKIAIASRSTKQRVPTLDTILNHAIKMDLEPSVAAEHYKDKFFELLYPLNIIYIAQNLNRLERTFKNAAEPTYDSSLESKKKWLDIAVKNEDATYPNNSNPISLLVSKNKSYLASLTKKIKSLESTYIQDAIKDHLGRSTSKFNSKDIVNITQINYQDLKPKSLHNAVIDNTEYDTELGGFFSKIFKVVLSPVQLFSQSVFSTVLKNTIGSSIVRKNIPSNLFTSLQGLSQASAQIAVGKVSKSNIRKAIKYSMKVTKATVSTVGKVYSEALKVYYAGYYLAMKTETGKTVDKYTGGIATSAMNLTQVTPDLMQEKKVDVKARAIDAIKVGAVVVSGGALSVAVSAGTTVATEKTSLGKSSIGRSLIQAGGIYASGGGSVTDIATKMATQKATTLAIKKASPLLTPILGDTASKIALTSLATATTSTAGTDKSFTQTLQNVATKSVASTATKKVTTKYIGQSAGNILAQTVAASVGNTPTTIKDKAPINAPTDSEGNLLNKTPETSGDSVPTNPPTTGGGFFAETSAGFFQTGSVDKNGNVVPTTSPTFFERVGASVRSETQLRVESSLDRRTGGKYGTAVKVVTGVNKYKDMTGEEFQARVEKERQGLYTRIEEERVKSEQRIEHIADQVEDASAEEAKNIMMKKIEEEERRLDEKVSDMSESFKKGIERVGSDVDDFDSAEFLRLESERLKRKLQAEKDRFMANATDRMWKLGQKYGMDLLAYLMWKYGPRSDYDDVMVDEDMVLYKNFVPSKDGRIYKKRKMGLGSKFALLVGGYVAYKGVMG